MKKRHLDFYCFQNSLINIGIISKTEALYQKFPLFLQNILVNARGFYLKNTRYNSKFRKELDKYNENFKNNRIAVDEKQLQDFLKTVETSYYWKSVFDKYKINLKSENLVAEIEKLPISSKAEVFNRANNL